MDLDAYMEHYPEAEVVSDAVWQAFQKTPAMTAPRTAPDPIPSVKVEFGGVTFPVRMNVPAEACLPLPWNYRVPTHGDLARDIDDLMVHIMMGRSCWIWGPPGAGKDAVFSAFCAQTRTPSIILTVVQGADIQGWKFTRGFNHQGTFWKEGVLLKAVRDGYLTADGERIPYLIVLSDFDRATRAQAEELRLVLDSIQGRILGPEGETYPVLPGTRIYITANTSGGGDHTGRHTSAMAFDVSLLNRVERKLHFHHLDPRDEEPILVEKFPAVVRAHKEFIPKVMEATGKIREAIATDVIFCEWGHRDTEHWVESAADILEVHGSRYDFPNLFRRSFRSALDGLPNDDTREGMVRLLDGIITGGMVPAGGTGHIAPTPLTP